jgi:type III restriction enzyme
MSQQQLYEVQQPILNSPFEEPALHWDIREGEPPQVRQGRRKAIYYYRDPSFRPTFSSTRIGGVPVEMELVNRIRERVQAWRTAGYPGVTRMTTELLQWWGREGRQTRLFFAQREAAETIIFLNEARSDFRQGIVVPLEELSQREQEQGKKPFIRYACKMATGSGKTMVMGMLAAWSILNKLNNRSDARFSDVVLVVCPNVTIRDRLAELDPELGEASIYRARDLVPSHLIPHLSQGRVLVTNWHRFELQSVQTEGAKVVKRGVPLRVRESIEIGSKTTTTRGRRYLSQKDLDQQVAAGLLTIVDEERDQERNLERVQVESVRYVESDSAWIARVFRELGGKQHLLVMNDEAHHAYRIKHQEPETTEEQDFGEQEEAEEFFQEATVWIEGLDRIHKMRGINFCVDLSATPYFLGRVGQDTNRPFPWVVSDFGLVEAIESGLTKIPQLAVRDTTGRDIPGYFNIWHWILPQLTAAERGGKKADPKPEAILKYAHTPAAMLGGLWEEEFRRRCGDAPSPTAIPPAPGASPGSVGVGVVSERHSPRRNPPLSPPASEGRDPRPPVFIIVCKTTRLAKVVYEWLAEDQAPVGIPSARLEGFRNREGQINTIRVDSKVIHETDTQQAKSDESRWMRFTLDTVGKLHWPTDRQERPIYPQGFEELARKLGRPLHPPGRDVRCIVSVGMLTEGWDCNTVTHIMGLRPFMSQLLCEQVVGRGLRRASYELAQDGRFSEEVAKVFGVPFEVIPFKAQPRDAAQPAEKRRRVHAVPAKAHCEICFPRVEGYTQAIRNRVSVDWHQVSKLVLQPGRIPPDVQMKAALPNNEGRYSVMGPGKIEDVNLNPYRRDRRLQELVFDMARALTRDYVAQPGCEAPAHVLFTQIVAIVQRYLREKVQVVPPCDIRDLFLAPYYGWAIERLVENIHPDTSQGEAPEIPRYETHRGPGSTAEVDFWTTRDDRKLRESNRCHLNYVVLDTLRWEQSAAYYLDTNSHVEAFVKNAALGFAIPYLHNGQMHDYLPDFIVRLRTKRPVHLILETKGYDPLEDVKRAAAERWVNAVNAEGSYGHWSYAIARDPEEVNARIAELLTSPTNAGEV